MNGLMKSYLNLSLILVIVNNSWWFLSKRSLLNTVLKKIHLIEDLSCESEHALAKYRRVFKIVTHLLLASYVLFYFMEIYFMFLFRNYDLLEDYSLAPCVGLELLSSSPNSEICLIIVLIHEFISTTVMMSFAALFLVLIAHTAVMFLVLAEDMTKLTDLINLADHRKIIRESLRSLINRHSLLLQIVYELRLLYSVPVGINFISNAMSILVLLCLPIHEWPSFLHIIGYCFFAFFLYCFLGQNVINASEKFINAVYCCGWEHFGVAEKKLVHVMLRQAQKPVEIIALGMISVNMNTYVEALQLIYKFVTVLKI
uniref:Odorant receptor n=1 Tax=Bombyx mori TaxID=7091 RepID=A0A8R2DM56_BOMMO|nr:olfactory receptor 55 isoform X1 [Bombyx mori]